MEPGSQFMYRYVSANTRSNPDGSPSGLVPDDRQFVIHTHDQPGMTDPQNENRSVDSRGLRARRTSVRAAASSPAAS